MDVKIALQSDENAAAYLAQWSNGTLPKEAFTHAGHVLVAAWHLTRLPFDDALNAVRTGIPRFNVAVGGQNTEDSGYHETATVFWMAKVGAFLRDLPPGTETLDQIRAAVDHYGVRRNWFAEHYSFDVIASRDARRRWIPPDLAPLDLAPAP